MQIETLRIVNLKSFADTGDLSLGSINVLVGRNNAGKSTVIRAAHLIQAGGPAPAPGDVRLGESYGIVEFTLRNISGRYFPEVPMEEYIKSSWSRLGVYTCRLHESAEGVTTATELAIRHPGSLGESHPQAIRRVGRQGFKIDQIPNTEHHNFIYPYLSGRKSAGFDRTVDLYKSREIRSDLRFLHSRIDVLGNPGHPKHEKYHDLCMKLLGFPVTALVASEGKQAGIMIGKRDRIYVEAMGEGVSSLLGLIASLCVADGNLFLIEEPENDLHPESLKALLEAIVETSVGNQFIISTHSNIVAKYLGSVSHSKVFEVTLESYRPGKIPTSTIREVEPTVEARIAVLRQLGYELYDFDLWDGWLILEESSAEVIIRDYLIPWFTPRLSRIRTVAAGGTSKVEPTFEDFWRLFLFAHLEPQYKERAWVVIDGDDTGKSVVAELQKKYAWPRDHFRTFQERNFEKYYPSGFSQEVDEALSKPHDEKRAAKRKLCNRVKQWCDSSPDEAKREFEQSAVEVVEILREIEKKLLRS